MRVPSPELMEAMCGADGALGTTVITRDTELAAAKVEFPGCDTSMVHDPIVRAEKIPVDDTAQTEPPCVTLKFTARPLDADASTVNSGDEYSTTAGCGNEIVWFNLPISIDWLTDDAASQRESPALLAVTVHRPAATKVIVPLVNEQADPFPVVSAMVVGRPDVEIALGAYVDDTTGDDGGIDVNANV